MLQRSLATAAAFALLALIFVSCGEDGSTFVPFQPPPDTTQDSTSFVGFLADGDQGARLDIIINAQSLAPAAFRSRAPHVPSPTVTAVGFLRWPGGDISLTGVYDFTADTLYLAGSGRELRGNFTDDGFTRVLSGTAATPNGPAGFMAMFADTAVSAQAWVGTFRADATPDSGTICFVRSGQYAVGQAFNAGADAGMSFTGSVSTGGPTSVINFAGAIPSMYSITGTGTMNDLTGVLVSDDYTINALNAAYGSSSDGGWSATRR